MDNISDIGEMRFEYYRDKDTREWHWQIVYLEPDGYKSVMAHSTKSYRYEPECKDKIRLIIDIVKTENVKIYKEKKNEITIKNHENEGLSRDTQAKATNLIFAMKSEFERIGHKSEMIDNLWLEYYKSSLQDIEKHSQGKQSE